VIPPISTPLTGPSWNSSLTTSEYRKFQRPLPPAASPSLVRCPLPPSRWSARCWLLPHGGRQSAGGPTNRLLVVEHLPRMGPKTHLYRTKGAWPLRRPLC
jgi:hypothetical protein